MELLEAVQKRHSVRMYQDREIPDSNKKKNYWILLINVIR